MNELAVLEQPEVKSSTHKAEVFKIDRIEKHAGADTLSVAYVAGFQTCIKTGDYNVGDLVVFVTPDSLVYVSRPEFSFLAKEAKSDGLARIRAKRLRGVLSFGLLIQAPEGAQEGDDVAEQLGITHYEPTIRRHGASHSSLYASGEVASSPNVYHVKYDVESGRRYAKDVMLNGEPVYISEKIHGANMRVCFHDGKMHCSSRTEWKKEYPTYDHVTVESLLATGKIDEERAKMIVDNLHNKPKSKNLWWDALDRTPALRAYCEEHPDVLVYGEVYGNVQELKYGHKDGEISFAAFDIMVDGQWLDADEFYLICEREGIPHVPVLHHMMPYDFDKVCELAEGKTCIAGADHVREGVVVRPRIERYDHKLGRVILKWVGAGYLERAK